MRCHSPITFTPSDCRTHSVGDDGERVLRDHKLFVGGNDVKSDLAVRLGNNQTCRVICCRVKMSAKPSQLFSHPAADHQRVFPNPGSENESIEATECRGQKTCTKSNSIDKMFDG